MIFFHIHQVQLQKFAHALTHHVRKKILKKYVFDLFYLSRSLPTGPFRVD
jgi:hypothetical protein